VVQVVEHLPLKLEALSSNPTTERKRERKERERERKDGVH
jgi:hypothetical protein